MVTPSFSIGTSSISPTTTARRSTRRAAMVATTRIAEELAPQRRSTRLATRGGSGAATTTTSSSAASTRSATAVPRGRTALPPVPKASPIVLDDDDEDDDMESMNLKPAAKVPVAEVAAALSALADFTCAICLDAPPAMSDVASISGCTHRFCFDCIDQWANTENRCPCCKARFRTIDRVVALPSVEGSSSSSSRKGKRKRSSNSTSSSPNSRLRSGGSTSSASSPNRRPNSRTVEDRNQQPMGIVIDAAFVQQILSSFMSATGGGRGSASGRAAAGGVGTAPGQVTFGTSEDGRPVIRVINPQGGGMVGVMEMYLSEGGAPVVPVGGGGSGATAAAGSGSTRVAVRISRPATTTTTTTTTATSSDPSRRFAGFGAAAANGRTMRPVTAEFMQQLAAGSSRSAARGSESTASPAAAAAAGSNSAASSRSVRFASNTGEGTDRVSSMARAHHQATSAIANLFVNHGVSGAGVSASSPRGRRGGFSVGGPSSSTSSNNGAAAAAAGASDGTSRQVMTIRIITRPMNASQSTSHSPAVRSNNRRGAASSPSDSGSSDDEPIIIV